MSFLFGAWQFLYIHRNYSKYRKYERSFQLTQTKGEWHFNLQWGSKTKDREHMLQMAREDAITGTLQVPINIYVTKNPNKQLAWEKFSDRYMVSKVEQGTILVE